MLVVHLHAQTVRGLRNLGNREAGLGRQRRAVDDQDAALKHLAHWLVEVVRVLELLVDELWSPAHDLADVGEAEHGQFAQNLLDRDFKRAVCTSWSDKLDVPPELIRTSKALNSHQARAQLRRFEGDPIAMR
jgi:hypothetical protein